MLSDQASLNSGIAVPQLVFILQHSSYSNQRTGLLKLSLIPVKNGSGVWTSGKLLDANVLNSALECGLFPLALRLAAMLYSF